jgi:hypothetical protein
VASGSSALVAVLVVSTALEAPARSWRSLGEEVRTASFSPFPLDSSRSRWSSVLLYGKRFEGTHGCPGEGLVRFVGICELRLVAGRGRENFFFFTLFPADCSGVAAAAR